MFKSADLVFWGNMLVVFGLGMILSVICIMVTNWKDYNAKWKDKDWRLKHYIDYYDKQVLKYEKLINKEREEK